MTLYVGYEPAARACTGSPAPGARALMSWYLGAYASLGARNLGIYNCRAIAGTATPSLHGEGRATDLGVPVGAAWAETVARALVDRSGELGLQCVIYNRWIWSGSYPYDGRRAYGGQNPHVDHIHAELSRHAARTLTPELVNAVMLGAIPPAASGPPRFPLPDGYYYGPLKGPKRSISGLHATDTDAYRAGLSAWQSRMNARGYALVTDGLYGPKTESVARDFQRRHGLVVDGLIGPRTWAASWA